MLSPSSVREYKRARKNYKDLKDIRIDDITQEDIQRHVNAFTEGHSPKSVRDNHALISAVLRGDAPRFCTEHRSPAEDSTAALCTDR